MPLRPDLPAAATLERPSDLLKAEMEAVEAVLQRYSTSEVEVLQQAARHILCAGGKRLRPQLLILAAQAAGGSAQRAVSLAAAAELVHTATLVHDDIVDESDSRRGRATVQFYIGNSASVLMGDYLVVRAFGIIGEDGDPRLWRVLVDTITRMCEGEVLQICIKGDTSIALDVYELIIECKTAALMSACGQFGAIVGDASGSVIDALGDFGYNVGMAFQIADDILDFTGDQDTLGKPVGGDLREGKVTLPVIYALEDAAADERRELIHLYEKQGPLTGGDVERVRELIRAAGGFTRARSHAHQYIERAHSSLGRIPPSAARDALRQLAETIVDRRA